jgi:hypothetical protein
MPAQHNSQAITILKAELEKRVANTPAQLQTIAPLFEDQAFIGPKVFFQKESPANQQVYKPTKSLNAEVDSVLAQPHTSRLLTTISAEEHQEIVGKLQMLLQMPPGTLDLQSELYLEQQISDMLGFEVTNELDGQKMLYTTGKIKALPHLRRHPTDTINNHKKYHYAGISQARSAFGWFMDQGTVTDTLKQSEEYYVALQLYYFKEWAQHHKTLKQWYKYRKVVVINPFDEIAVVSKVAAIGPRIPLKYQFGASPEVIIEGKLWSRQAAGKAIVLFVDDVSDNIPVGPVSLH